jgi:hypothetical protein
VFKTFANIFIEPYLIVLVNFENRVTASHSFPAEMAAE